MTEVAELKAARDQLASALREKEDEMAALVSTHEQDFEEVQTELGETQTMWLRFVDRSVDRWERSSKPRA